MASSKVPRISPPPDSMLCQVWKSCAKHWWPGMSNQTCNQNWTRGQRVRTSQFLWLIVAIYTIQLVVISRNPLNSYLTVYKTVYKTHHGPVIVPFPVQYFKWLLHFLLRRGCPSKQPFLLLLMICCGYAKYNAEGAFAIISFICSDFLN